MPDKLTIKQLRRLNNITIKQAAEKIQVSEPTWGNYENGRTDIPAEKFLVFCKWIQVNPENVKWD